MIHFVVGTRAQLFKMAPIMRECRARELHWRWIYTAQHRDTVQETLRTFELPAPDHVVVRWNTEAKSMASMSLWGARMLAVLPRSSRILDGRTGSNHVLLTHGDTFTTWLGALMGRLTRTRVMHVEAGLRSFNLLRPFPEEINRLVTFRLANYYACPGEWAVANLRRYPGTKIDTEMNTQLDTLRFGLGHLNGVVLDVPEASYVVASIHRYENIFKRERFGEIVRVLERVANRFHLLFILHPATQGQLDKFEFRERLERNPRIKLVPRLEYLPFLKAVTGCEFVITDGGGNQEELSYLGKPVLILRSETERREGIGANAVIASSLDDGFVDDFLGGYERYHKDLELPSVSPAATIVDWLEQQGFGANR